MGIPEPDNVLQTHVQFADSLGLFGFAAVDGHSMLSKKARN